MAAQLSTTPAPPPHVARTTRSAIPRLHHADPPAALSRLALANNIAVMIELLDELDGQGDYDGEELDCCPAGDDGGRAAGSGFGHPGDDADAEPDEDREPWLGWTLGGVIGGIDDREAEYEGGGHDVDDECRHVLPVTPDGGILGGGAQHDMPEVRA